MGDLPDSSGEPVHPVQSGSHCLRYLLPEERWSDKLAKTSWLRLPGDVLFIGRGVLPLVWMAFQGVRHRGSHQDALDDEDLLLFTEVTPAPPPSDDEMAGAH